MEKGKIGGIEKKIFMLLVINTAGILVNFFRCYWHKEIFFIIFFLSFIIELLFRCKKYK